MTSLEDSVWELLDTVRDPCSVRMGKPLGLVGMGLVESAVVDDDAIRVRLVLTSPGCVFYFQFVDAIAQVLEPVAEGRDIDVTIDYTVMWTADRMNPLSIRKTLE